TEDINLPELLCCLLHQPLHVGFFANICDNRCAVNFCGYALCALLIDIGDYDGPRSLSGKRSAERLPDSIRPASYNHDSVPYLHAEDNKWFRSMAATLKK